MRPTLKDLAFTFTPCVLITVGTKKRNEDRILPDDEGFVTSLLEWERDQNCYPIRSIVSGPGIYAAIFAIEDAGKVYEFLAHRLPRVDYRG